MGWIGSKAIDAIEKEKNELVTTVRSLRENANTNDVRMTQIISKLQDHLDEHAGKRKYP